MAVAHSAASESHTGTTGSTNQTSFNWTHTQTGTPQGVLVFVHTISASNFISSVTYGTVTLTRVVGAVAIDATVEPGRTDLFFAGLGLPSGNQTITVNRTNNATVMYASAATVTAAADVNVTGIQVEEDNQALAEVAVNDGSSGINSVRYAATYYGANSPAPAGASSTLLTSIDLGSFGNSMVRETTAGQGARNVGFSAASDDVAAVYVAVREVTAWSTTGGTGSFTLTGNAADLAVVSPKLLDAVVGAFTFTGNPVDFARQYSITIDAGGFTLTGNDATLGHNVKIDGGTRSFSLTGNDVTLTVAGGLNNYSLSVDAGSFALAGGAPSLSRSYALAAGTGAVVLTGNPAGLADTDQLQAEVGTFLVTGGAPALLRTYYLSGGAGSFIETGQAVTLTRSWALAPATGLFALTGNPALLTTIGAVEIDPIAGAFALTGGQPQLLIGRIAKPATGAFTLGGQPITLPRSWALTADRGQFQLTGNAAGLSATELAKLDATAGSFAFTGRNAALSIGRKLAAATGGFTFTGNAAGLADTDKLAAQVGSFSATGHPAAFRYFKLLADTGTLALTGNAAALARAISVPVTVGSYSLTGNTSTLLRGLVVVAERGQFALTGNPAALTEIEIRRRVIVFF